VLLQVGRELGDGHAIDARRPLVALDLLQRLQQIATLDNSFHRRPRGRRAFEAGFRRADFGLLGGGAAGFTRSTGSQVQLHLILLPHRSVRDRHSTGLFHRSGLRQIAPPTMPSADFSAAITGLAARSVRLPRHGRDLPR